MQMVDPWSSTPSTLIAIAGRRVAAKACAPAIPSSSALVSNTPTGMSRGSASAASNTVTIPGLLTDGVALGAAGWSAVTLSRGGLATLWRIHRAADTAERLSGVGMHEVARLVASAAREIA
jgi:hypothetical protein